ncbi:hypothetical protein VU05_02935 [Desulfobulbus sp. F1]|nr:hypothetical protein [Desulfobulbus sp. F1]
MNNDLKKSIDRLTIEIKNDIYFFGGCGFLVGIMLIWQARFKEIGIADNPKWASETFNDFLSGNAFGFIFFIYVLLGTANNVIGKFGYNSSRIENIINHIGDRFYQIGSSIVSFTIGFIVFVFIYSLFNCEIGTIRLFLTASLFSIFIATIVVMADILARRVKPFDKHFALLAVILLVIYLFMRLVGRI